MTSPLGVIYFCALIFPQTNNGSWPTHPSLQKNITWKKISTPWQKALDGFHLVSYPSWSPDWFLPPNPPICEDLEIQSEKEVPFVWFYFNGWANSCKTHWDPSMGFQAYIFFLILQMNTHSETHPPICNQHCSSGKNHTQKWTTPYENMIVIKHHQIHG